MRPKQLPQITKTLSCILSDHLHRSYHHLLHIKFAILPQSAWCVYISGDFSIATFAFGWWNVNAWLQNVHERPTPCLIWINDFFPFVVNVCKSSSCLPWSLLHMHWYVISCRNKSSKCFMYISVAVCLITFLCVVRTKSHSISN